MRRAAALLACSWVLGCGTAHLGRVTLERPAGLEEGPLVTGRSCALHVLGLPLGATALDDAVTDALQDANEVRVARAGGGAAYNALVDVWVEEQLGPVRRCVVVRGRAVTTAANRGGP